MRCFNIQILSVAVTTVPHFVNLSKVRGKQKQAECNFDDIESIEFKNVSFTYPSAENSTINDMSFKVNKGENIAIVGENGAGKTTGNQAALRPLLSH